MPVRRGEIYFVNLNPTKGREQAGERPVLIISNDMINKLPLVVTVIVGTKSDNIQKDFPTNILVTSSESGLPFDTVFLCFQVRSLDPKRFPSKPAGNISEQKMEQVEETIRFCLDL